MVTYFELLAHRAEIKASAHGSADVTGQLFVGFIGLAQEVTDAKDEACAEVLPRHSRMRRLVRAAPVHPVVHHGGLSGLVVDQPVAAHVKSAAAFGRPEASSGNGHEAALARAVAPKNDIEPGA